LDLIEKDAFSRNSMTFSVIKLPGSVPKATDTESAGGVDGVRQVSETDLQHLNLA
jgi:hypothetical protein